MREGRRAEETNKPESPGGKGARWRPAQGSEEARISMQAGEGRAGRWKGTGKEWKECPGGSRDEARPAKKRALGLVLLNMQ